MEEDQDENRRVQQYQLHDFRKCETWKPLYHTGTLYSQKCMMETPKYTISELHFGKFPDSGDIQCWRVNFKTDVCVCIEKDHLQYILQK